MRKISIDWNLALDSLPKPGAGGPVGPGLAQLVSALRAGTPGDAVLRLEGLCDHLEHEAPGRGGDLGRLLRQALRNSDCVLALSDSGVPSDRGFADELMQRLGRRLLPEVQRPEDLRILIRTVFPDERDYEWLRAIPLATWKRFLGILGFSAQAEGPVSDDLASAIRVLTHHVTSLALHPYLTERLRELDDLDSPFLQLSHLVLEYLESFENDIQGDEEPLLDRALASVRRCRSSVRALRRKRHRYGTSLRLTALSRRLLAKLERLELLLHLSEPVERNFRTSAVRLLLDLVEAENTRNHLAKHVRQSVDLLAFQVVEHAARKGAKYITTTWRDYGRFLLSSMGGGFIVAIFALFKVLLDKLDVSLAMEAFLFGMNYSVCFILIYLTGSTLATKQPAMTANTIARSIGAEGKAHQLDTLADLIVRVSRSQFVSFLGNLVCALPAALLMSYLYEMATGSPPIDTDKAAQLLSGLHPWRSGALLYAAIAGVFLFATGLVSGFVDNRLLYRQVPARVSRHPALVRWCGAAGAERVGAWVHRNLGVLTGNVFLGFALGSAGTIGVILGLPFDIRHIAFGASHFGMSVEALHGEVPLSLVLVTMVGVALIGLLNFVVSFSLALSIAFESRRVTFGEGRALLDLLGRRLLREPWWFFVPPFGRSGTRSGGG